MFQNEEKVREKLEIKHQRNMFKGENKTTLYYLWEEVL